MKLLKTIKHSDLFPEDKRENEAKYLIRKAARAVVFDDDNKIAILRVTKHNYHKIPGGGVEKNEDITEALEREALEETGCKISVTGEIGEIVEFRDKLDLEQKSYCYLAKVIGEKSQPNFTEEESDDGFEILWTTMDEAIEILKKDKPDDYEGKFIQVRDLCFLEEAR
jgi:8-oxo-dGTP diphosphatase